MNIYAHMADEIFARLTQPTGLCKKCGKLTGISADCCGEHCWGCDECEFEDYDNA